MQKHATQMISLRSINLPGPKDDALRQVKAILHLSVLVNLKISDDPC